MKKDTLRALIVAVVIFAVYNLIAFAVPFVHTEAFWISYGFTVAAFIVTAAAIYITFVSKGDAKSRFYRFPIARVGVIYGIVQVIASLIVMAVAWLLPWWIPTIVYAIFFALAVIGLVGTEAVVDQIETMDTKLKKDTTLMRTLQSKVSQLAAQSDSVEIKALAEEFRYSDPVSNDAIMAAETDLAAAVNELQIAFVDGDSEAVALLCRKTTMLLAERNRLCKLNK